MPRGRFCFAVLTQGSGCVCVCERGDVSYAKTVTLTHREQTPGRAVVMEMLPGPL